MPNGKNKKRRRLLPWRACDHCDDDGSFPFAFPSVGSSFIFSESSCSLFLLSSCLMILFSLFIYLALLFNDAQTLSSLEQFNLLLPVVLCLENFVKSKLRLFLRLFWLLTAVKKGVRWIAPWMACMTCRDPFSGLSPFILRQRRVHLSFHDDVKVSMIRLMIRLIIMLHTHVSWHEMKSVFPKRVSRPTFQSTLLFYHFSLPFQDGVKYPCLAGSVKSNMLTSLI